MDSKIKPFYNKSNILITGGTGLLGQLLVEKLLRVCTDIEGIYLIVREKKGKSISERMLTVYKDPLFDKLRKINPEFIKKIHVLEGDCSQLKLGLDEASRQILIDKINVIFHCAASLNMEAKLEDAICTNVRSLIELIDLCRKMPNLKSMVYVSTAYSNSVSTHIDEKFYKPPLKPGTALKIIEEMDPEILACITPELIGKWPNTYCYSKTIAEDLINNNAGTLPIGLFRPSVIMPTYMDPIPGWTCNLYGPVGFFLAAGLGVLRVTYCDLNGKIDLVPADLCTNALICTAWETSLNFESSSSVVPILNYSGGYDRNITIKTMTDYAFGYQYPLKEAIWATSHVFTKNKTYYNILQVFLHYIPGYIFDAYLVIRGKKARLVKAYGKLTKMTAVLSFFTCQEWDIKNDNVYKLWDKLNDTDKQLFPFNMKIVNYKDYLLNCAFGIKVYILKESLDSAEEDKKRYQRLVKLHQAVKLSFLILLIFLLSKIWNVLLP